MHHRTLDEVTQVATITAAEAPPSRMARRERLRRLADILESHHGPIQLLSRMEDAPMRERRQLRCDFSPLSLAFQDAGLRREGLAGDRLGDAMTFFGLSPWQAHHLFCDCHYAAVNARAVAQRVRSVADRRSLLEVWQAVWSRVAPA